MVAIPSAEQLGGFVWPENLSTVLLIALLDVVFPGRLQVLIRVLIGAGVGWLWYWLSGTVLRRLLGGLWMAPGRFLLIAAGVGWLWWSVGSGGRFALVLVLVSAGSDGRLALVSVGSDGRLALVVGWVWCRSALAHCLRL